MNIPEIGEIITCDRAIELSDYYGLEYLVKRIEEKRDSFKDWEFDGVSMIPDDLFSRMFHVPNLTEIALQHDLKYAYGEAGNKTEKLRADLELELSLLNDGASPEMAKLMFTAVDIGGNELLKTSYSWGYARK